MHFRLSKSTTRANGFGLKAWCSGPERCFDSPLRSDPAIRDSSRLFQHGNLLCSAKRPRAAKFRIRSGQHPEVVGSERCSHACFRLSWKCRQVRNRRIGHSNHPSKYTNEKGSSSNEKPCTRPTLLIMCNGSQGRHGSNGRRRAAEGNPNPGAEEPG
jgi:hypothetical protein